jgi:hypothetical protein
VTGLRRPVAAGRRTSPRRGRRPRTVLVSARGRDRPPRLDADFKFSTVLMTVLILRRLSGRGAAAGGEPAHRSLVDAAPPRAYRRRLWDPEADVPAAARGTRRPRARRAGQQLADLHSRGRPSIPLRAAVILAWTAVAFDVIAKLRELATHGDAGAATFVAELNAAVAASDVSKLQQLENRLLDQAQSPFEMISARERQDLDRLKEDRNACAHPAFATAGAATLFTPSPELVRAHVVHAINHLLRHPPVQGKAALERLKHDLLQPSFPRDQGQATTFLRTRYLSRLKPALVENLVTILLKVLLRGADPDLAKRPGTILRALLAIRGYGAASPTTSPSSSVPETGMGAYFPRARLARGNMLYVWGHRDLNCHSLPRTSTNYLTLPVILLFRVG